jgi:phosphoribosyl 1,2-cyclic phosphate phosphodiesterase
MRVTFLGTGTSHGVPIIGCGCPVCRSGDPRNQRHRCSILIEVDGVKLLVDTPPELRIQLLRENIATADAVLFTHAHADHIFGLDDVRRFNDANGRALSCYGSEATLATVRRTFEYVFVPTQLGGGKPQLDLIPVENAFSVGGVGVTIVPVLHGELPVYGYKIGGFAYVTDCSAIPSESAKLLTDLDTLVLGVLRPEPHETHFSLSEGLAVVDQLRPRRAYFTHISHRLDHERTNAILPPGVEMAYDGLKLMIDGGAL